MHCCPSVALLVAITSPLVAQEMPVGSVTVQMSITLPDSMKAAAAIGRNIDMRMTMAIDEERLLATTGLRGMMAQIPGLANIEQAAYGDRKMTAIRTATVKSGLHVELVSYTTGVPDEARFTRPADLKPTPMPAMPGKPGGR